MVNFINQQTDIDSILKGAAVAKNPPVDAEAYNFLRPHRISKDRRNALTAIYQRFGLSMQTLLTSRFRQTTDVTITSVEQATFAEFIMSLAAPCAAFVFDLGDGSGIQGVLDIGTELAFRLVDRMFGGPGLAGDTGRAPTALEQLVLKQVIDYVLQALGDAWSEYLPFKPVQVAFDSTPDHLAVANREDAVLLTNVEVKTNSASANVTLCIPLIALESFLQEKRSVITRAAQTDNVEREAARAGLDASLRRAQVPVAARFPMVAMSARSLVSLEVGHVIATGIPTDTPVEVLVAGRTRFIAAAGQVRRRAGIRILHGAVSSSPNIKTRARARIV